MAPKKEKGAGAPPAKGKETPKAAAPKAAKAEAAPPKDAKIPPPPPSQAELAAPAVKRHGFRRKLIGKVTSDKMNKTVVVEVVRSSMDPVYKKIVRARERYKAHDETNQYKVGDRVEIQEHRPISADKRWLVTKLVLRQETE
jgi:small subunit ribosomal protein S17